MKVNILGIQYEIIEQDEKENTKLEGNDGLCENYARKIILRKNIGDDEMSVDNIEEYKKKVLRHEIIHAFIFNSGLDVCCEWARDESLIDWISIQIPRIYEAMQKTQCI